MIYRILLIDESCERIPLLNYLVSKILEREVRIAHCSPKALKKLAEYDCHLIIISNVSADLELVEKIKRTNPLVNVIVISAEATVEKAVLAIRLGAEDYLAEPFRKEMFQLAVSRCFLGKEDSHLSTEAYRMIYCDEITGLFNNRYLHKALEDEFEKYSFRKKPFAILFMDVDRFKAINDCYGHQIGTQVLCELGQHLKQCVRKGDLVFRYGGDEFIALLSPSDPFEGRVILERIRSTVERKEFLKTKELNIKVTLSVGIAVCPIDSTNPWDILNSADRSMYVAKERASRRAGEMAWPCIQQTLKRDDDSCQVMLGGRYGQR